MRPAASASASARSVRSHVKSLSAAAEVTVRGRLAIDRPTQVEIADDCAGPQVEDLADSLLDRVDADLLGAERLDEDRERVRHADGVGELDLAAIGKTGCHDVLGDPARSVGGRAVDLGAVLARERAAAVTTDSRRTCPR